MKIKRFVKAASKHAELAHIPAYWLEYILALAYVMTNGVPAMKQPHFDNVLALLDQTCRTCKVDPDDVLAIAAITRGNNHES